MPIPNRLSSRAVPWVGTVAVCFAVLMGIVILVMASMQQGLVTWFAPAGFSRSLLLSAAGTSGCAACLVAIFVVLWRIGRRHRFARVASGGAVVLEFALALPIALVLSLIMAQSALLMAGNFCAHYSACCAARSASVQIPLEVSDDEPANFLDEGHRSIKLDRVRDAALWAVMPTCPSKSFVGTDSKGDALAEGLDEFFASYGRSTPWWVSAEYLGRKFAYAEQYTDVTLMQRVDSTSEDVEYTELGLPYTYGDHEEVRVDVDHAFYLAVPYAARIFAALNSGTELSFGRGEYGLEIRASCSITNEGARDYIEVETFD